jgi:protein-S-isoprenylcysteine O-methyltransferase Ste14
MYVGIMLSYLAAPLLLGSMWAYVPATAVILLFIWRTALEDRTLRQELPGYEEYAQRTRFRLLPALW